MSVDAIEILTTGPISASLRPPSSKSITNRVLICAALAEGVSTIRHPLESDDTHVMIDSLRRLGFDIDQQPDVVQIVGGGGKIPQTRADLFIGNSGTSVRFLTSMVAVGQGEYTLDGVPRMQQRPIQDLIDALRTLGVTIDSRDGSGCPPVVVHANGIRGGAVSIRGDVSSQFLSSLLMSSSYADRPVKISIDGELVSRPYVSMTTSIMEQFGVLVYEEAGDFLVPQGRYAGREFSVEPDASAASYFWAAAAITGGTATVLGLTPESLQGDVRFCELLVRMGCRLEHSDDGMTIHGSQRLQGIDCDMNDISDTVQTLTAVALFAQGPTRVRGVAHNRHKETDRIGNLAIELRKFGAQVDEYEDGMTVHPPEIISPATVDTYDDHRMAMSLALPGLRVPGVVIRDPGCTAKTYPRFFTDLRQASAIG